MNRSDRNDGSHRNQFRDHHNDHHGQRGVRGGMNAALDGEGKLNSHEQEMRQHTSS